MKQPSRFEVRKGSRYSCAAAGRGEQQTSITRLVSVEGELDSQQYARLADIADRTALTLTLKRGAEITTTPLQ